MKVWDLGVGMGLQPVTPEVADALRTVDYVVAAERGPGDGRLALRRAIVAAHGPPACRSLASPIRLGTARRQPDRAAQGGRPVHITTARRFADAVAAGQDNIVAMLNPEGRELAAVSDSTIWWGANLGARWTSDQRRLGDVLAEIATARAAAKVEAGRMLDLFQVRRP